MLGALSLLLNGGGVAQLKTITQELNRALEGREDSARSVLRNLHTFTGQLDENKTDIVDAIESLNRLSLAAEKQLPTIDKALDELPSALDSIDRQRDDLVEMLAALDRLSSVAVDVITRSKDATITSLQRLDPVLTQLAASGDDFTNAFHVFLTYPFVDEVVGRDPQVARNLHMGDYTNLSITLDVDLTGIPTTIPTTLPTEACIPLSALPQDGPLPDTSKLCQDALDAINDVPRGPASRRRRGMRGPAGLGHQRGVPAVPRARPLRGLGRPRPCRCRRPRCRPSRSRPCRRSRIPGLPLPGLPGPGRTPPTLHPTGARTDDRRARRGLRPRAREPPRPGDGDSDDHPPDQAPAARLRPHHAGRRQLRGRPLRAARPPRHRPELRRRGALRRLRRRLRGGGGVLPRGARGRGQGARPHRRRRRPRARHRRRARRHPGRRARAGGQPVGRRRAVRRAAAAERQRPRTCETAPRSRAT